MVPPQFQPLFSDRNQQFNAIGQDGTLTGRDWENTVSSGLPISNDLMTRIQQLQSILFQNNMQNNQPGGMQVG